MIDLGAFLDHRLLDLDEVADSCVGGDVRSRSQPGERADGRAPRHPRALEMREGADERAVLDPDPRPDHDMGLDEDVAAHSDVEREEHGLGGDKRRALGHRATAQPILQRRLGGGELRPVVDAHHLLLVRDQGPRDEAAGARDLDDVGEVVFPLGIIGRHSIQ